MSNLKPISNKINPNLILLISFLLLLAFDFRSVSSTEKIIVMFLSLSSIFCGFLLVLSEARFIYRHSVFLVFSTGLLVLVSIITSYIHETEIQKILANVLPLVFFIVSFLILNSVKSNIIKDDQLINLIVWFCFLSLIFKVIFGFFYSGFTLSNVRYQIISPVIILPISYGLTSLLLFKVRFQKISIILPFLIIFMSITRTYMLVVFIMVLSIIFMSGFRNIKKYLSKFFVGFIACTFFMLFIFMLNPELVDRWSLRLIGSFQEKGVDVTGITRLAEIEYQVTTLTESWANIIFGMGISAETKFSSNYDYILSEVYSADFEYIGTGFGHNTWVGTFFVGGLLFGGLFNISILYYIFMAISKSKQVFNQYSITQYHDFYIVWGGVSLIGYFVYGFFGGIYGDRVMSSCFGISFGLLMLGIQRKNEIK